jgi:hypothetical protein
MAKLCSCASRCQKRIGRLRNTARASIRFYQGKPRTLAYRADLRSFRRAPIWPRILRGSSSLSPASPPKSPCHQYGATHSSAVCYIELAQLGTDADLEVLRFIQDRYGKLSIPKERRPHLGDAALQHLGLPTTRDVASNVYVAIYPDRIDLLSPYYRNAKNVAGHSALDDLP